MVRDMTEDPFETVVAAHHAEIHRYLVRATSRPGEADDLSQETFVRAYKAYRALPPDANVRAWLFAIATNLCRNHYRAEGRRRQAMAAAAAGASERGPSWPEGEAIANQASARIDLIVAGAAVQAARRPSPCGRSTSSTMTPSARASSARRESARAHVFQALRKIRQGLDDLDVVHTERQP